MQVSFASNGTEYTAPPWMLVEAIKKSGVNLFVDCAEVSGLQPASMHATFTMPYPVWNLIWRGHFKSLILQVQLVLDTWHVWHRSF